MNRRRLAGAALVLVVLGLLVTSVAAAPAGRHQGGEEPIDRSGSRSAQSPLGTADRVLIFSVPTLSWADLRAVEAPNLEGLLDRSAIADLSVRSVTRRVDATDGYATLNAGTRTEGTSLASVAFVSGVARSSGTDPEGDPVDVPSGVYEVIPPEDDVTNNLLSPPQPDEPPLEPGQVPDTDEVFDGSPAAEEFARRTGVMPPLGSVFNLGLVSMRHLNSSLLFGSEVGALGDALESAGVRRAVIANGDLGKEESDVAFRREASIALMNSDGLVRRGRVGRTLLADDSSSPFGTRLDIDSVVDSFEKFWLTRSVVLVEASDMVRAEAMDRLALERQRARLRTRAIERSDELFGRLLEHVDLERDAVIVVSPYASKETTSLTVVGVHAPAVEPGWLSSGTTRRSGFAQTVDVAPSVLSLMEVPQPSSMEGTPMERSGAGPSAQERRTYLVEADQAARFRDRMIGPASTSFVLGQVALWALALLALSRGTRPRRLTAEVLGLALLAYLPMTYLAGGLPFHRWGAGAYWAFLISTSFALAAAFRAVARRSLIGSLMGVLTFLVGFMSIDIVMGGPRQFNTVFGYTPTVAGRFNGMGNPAFSMTTAAGIILAALIAHRVGGRRGAWWGIALLGWIVVLDGAPFLGADVGGILTLVPTVVVTAGMLLGVRLRVRTALWASAAAVAVTLAFGFLDLLRPPAQQTHLGRLLSSIGADGYSAFETVVLRKLNANLSVLTSSIWTLMLPLVFGFMAYVMWRSPWRLRRIIERIPEQRAAAAGLITSMVLGFALNDSGISIPGMMLGVANASLVVLLVRVDSEDGAGPAVESAPEADDSEDAHPGEQFART